MKIWVEHEVSNHPNSCLYYSDGSFMDGREVCKYHKFLTQTHGKKRPPDKNKPKCILFDTWLHEPYKKCFECRNNVGYNQVGELILGELIHGRTKIADP